MQPRVIVVTNLRGGVWETYLEMQRRVYDANGLSPTIKARTSDIDNSLAIKILEKVKEKKGTLEQIANWKSYQNPLNRVLGNNSIAPTITTRVAESIDGVINASMIVYGEDFMETKDIKKDVLNGESYRIRKLTPKECGRLMGVKDEDIDNMASGQSNMSLYHLFGDSIVVDCLMAIFKEMI